MRLTPSYRDLFRIRGFTRLVAGMLLGRVASQMVALVLVLLVLERYGSPELAGIATFLSLIPGLLVSPIAGTLLDRYGRRRLILVDYAVATSALLLIAVLSLAGALPVPLLLLIVAMQSLTFPLSTVGMRTLFPLVVPRPLWERANAIDSNGYAVSTIIGPALAGAVVAAFHGEGGLVAAALVFAIAAVVTFGVHDVDVRGGGEGHLVRAALEGVVYVAKNTTLRGLAIAISVGNVAGGILYIAVPVIVLRRLGGSTTVVGELYAGMGVAAFVSVMLIGRVPSEGRERALMLLAISVQVAAIVALVFGRTELAIVAVAMVVRGAAEGFYDVPMFTLRQRRTDPAWLGRAFAVSMSLNFIGMPIGSAVGGALVAAGPELALSAALVFAVASGVAMYLFVPRA